MIRSLRTWITPYCIIGAGLIFSSGCATQEGPSQAGIVDQALNTYYQGEKLERDRQLEQARDAYQKSIEISPRPRAYFRLATIQYHLVQTEEAKASAQAALRLTPTYQQPQLLLQKIEAEQGGTAPAPSEQDISEAIDQETGLTDTQPSSPDQPTPATPEPSVAAPAAPISSQPAATPVTPLDTDSEALFSEAKQAAAAGDWARSLSLNERVLEKNPDHPTVLYSYGYALFQAGRLEEALAAFNKVIEANPQFADAYNDLGVTLEASGRSGEAMAAYQKAIDVGNHGDAHFNLALLKEKTGDYKGAIGLYEDYLKFDSVSAYAQYARERINKLRRNAF